MTAGLFATLIAAAIVLGGAAVLAVLYLVVSARQSASIQRRLSPGGPEPSEFEGGGGDLLRSIAVKGKQVEKLVDTNNESQRLLLQAGWRAQHHRVAYYAAQLLVPVVMVGLVIVFGMVGPDKFTKGPLLFLGGAFAAMLGLLIPRMVLRSRAEARVRKIKSEVPLFIHLLVLLFEAGLSTRQAFASLVRDGAGVLPELGKEFDLVLRQLEAGGETSEVLQHLSQGIDLEDLTSVLALLRQVDKYGGEVRDPLLETLKVIEERRSLDMREMVNLISGRMTVVMVLFFFPALLIFTGGPAAMAVVKALGSVSGK
jgi:tight adherence protein C